VEAFQPILSQAEINNFDRPKNYSDKQLEELFRMPEKAESYLKTLRTPVSKLSFILQFAYCQSESRLYSPTAYHDSHILKIIRLRMSLRPLKTIKSKKGLHELKGQLGGSALNRHREVVLEILGFSKINPQQLKQLNTLAAIQARNQTGPEALLRLLVKEIEKRRLIIPSLALLDDIISKHYFEEEKQQLNIIKNELTVKAKKKLDYLLELDSSGECLLQKMKKIEQSIRPRDLQKNAKLITSLMDIYNESLIAIKALDLNSPALHYYSRWIISTDIKDINKISDPNKRYLYVLGFVISQLYERQDAATEGFIKKYLSYVNQAKKQSEVKRLKQASEQSVALEAYAKANGNIMSRLEKLASLGIDESISTDVRLTKIVTGLVDIIGDDEKNKNNRKKVDELIDNKKTNRIEYFSLLEIADSIIYALSSTLKSLVFSKECSENNVYQAIVSFQKNRAIETLFLSRSQNKLLKEVDTNKNHIKLYKIFLFEAVVNGLKAGSLNLRYTFVWQSIDSLMIGEKNWEKDVLKMLATYGMQDYKEFQTVRDLLTKRQDEAIEKVNENIEVGVNSYLKPTKNGKFKLRQYRADVAENIPSALSEMLYEVEKLSIKDVIGTINKSYCFADNFVHARKKFVDRKINSKLIMAGLISLGCNIGPRAMIKCSDGINESSFLKTIEHRLTPNNLRRANDQLASAIKKLSLSSIFQHDKNTLHTSSDGQKLYVDGESLMSSRSFKYFGSESGLARYPFIDEINRMLDTKVFSASIREASYVLDAHVGNIGNLNRIHSTDTHGYTDAVFGSSFLMGIEFAPRIKNIEKLGLYGTRTAAYYKKKGYKIRPSSNIKWSKIESHWVEILRFVITIRSGKASASQLFKRLNSYSKSPLYDAIKEFGKVIRTMFVLRYIDELEYRKRIQKQLNLGEQANSFFKAVFWARGHRLRVNRPGDEERYLLSAQLLQNCVILWNYLYVTKAIINMTNLEDRETLLMQLKRGQMLTWKHINFSGEFDFRKYMVQNFEFNKDELEAFQVS